MPQISVDTYSLELPEGWHTKLLAVTPPMEQYGRNEPAYQPSVIVNYHPRKAGTDLETVLKDSLAEMKVVLRSFKENKREFIDIDGEKAALVDFSFVQEGMMLRQLNCFRLYGEDRILMMNASHLMGKRFDAMRAKFIEVFQSITVPKK